MTGLYFKGDSSGERSLVIVMGFVYRSIRIGMVSVLPNILPLVITAALLALGGWGLEIVTVCAFTICLGIAVDDTESSK